MKIKNYYPGWIADNICVVCDDSRPFVLQVHHADPERKTKVILCANCHDTVRRGTFEDLWKAHERGNV